MPIREATWSDLRPAARIATVAFFDDIFSGNFLRPNRHLYPEDSDRTNLRKLREAYFAPNATVLVCYSSEISTSGTTRAGTPTPITGVAIWNRSGDGGEALKKSQSWLNWMAMQCITLINKIHGIIYPDRALDMDRFALLPLSKPFWHHHFEEPSRKELLRLNSLAIDPKYQGKGYGREMVMWGVQRAAEENIVVGMMSSHEKEGFYQKCGFKLVGWGGEGVGNPVGHIPGGAILFIDRNEENVEEIIEEIKKER